jgi:hypothetical protein
MLQVCPTDRPYIYLGGYFYVAGASESPLWNFARFHIDPKSAKYHTFEPLQGPATNSSDQGFHGTDDSKPAFVNTLTCVSEATCDVMYAGGLFAKVAGVAASGVVRMDVTNW